MFFDIGPLELVALVILAVLVFGPDKLPKVIQDAARFIRKVREFSDSAKEDIRTELGPDFKDFEFDDLNPKTFARKHLLDKDELGLKEIRNGFDFKKEMAEVADAAHSYDASGSTDSPPATPPSGGSSGSSSGGSDLLRKRDKPERDDPPPFDSDAT
ncbi:sec-independent translocase [Streptomyces zagrosensis]|uniref:Sec-independent protein translocase protein TatB n=1 Tax=Streptomyces zagrosensis TaxID=1042984 RepID=A0A7W9QAW1_9ACTN|nr:sec-independent translocase [Streptomyces zagrosensis]MBB5936770.1 sec-independent protein translocase protein TatB [Streptomyces zagrosensis]